MPIPLSDPTLDHLIAQMQDAMARFVNGDAAAFKALWSHQPDVTIFGGWGAYEQGWEAVGPRLDWAAARYVAGEVTCETLSRGMSGDLAYTVWLEHSAARLSGQEETGADRLACDSSLSPRGGRLADHTPPRRPGATQDRARRRHPALGTRCGWLIRHAGMHEMRAMCAAPARLTCGYDVLLSSLGGPPTVLNAYPAAADHR